MAPARIRVWDGLVRALHWTLAAVAVRLVWGWVGGRYARLAQFLRGPRAVLGYARALRAGHEQRYIGHNPLGGWMALALWLCATGRLSERAEQ